MTASEASALTARYKAPTIQQWLNHVYGMIEKAATAPRPKSFIEEPFANSLHGLPSQEEERAIWTHLRGEGYTVETGFATIISWPLQP